MKNFGSLALLATLLASAAPGRSVADDVREIASFKGRGDPLGWVALSADGSRLAAAGCASRTARGVPGEVAIWDVVGGTRVGTCKGPNASFTYAEFSADGGTLLTIDHGIGPSDGQVKVAPDLRVRAGSGYQAWDVATGKAIGPPLSPPNLAEFTTAALSPDGRYLATVLNERVTGADSSPIKPFGVREVTVWDLANRKAAWRLPGVAHTGRVTWSDSLAFSPDGKRLAVFMAGSGGPSSERTSARPDRPQASFKSLRMLSLEGGKGVPPVIFEKPDLLQGSLTWNSDGRALVVRQDRTLDLLDPASGRKIDSYFLPFPQPEAPRAPGRNFPLPPPVPNRNDQPADWYEFQLALSADGSRLAAHYVHQLEDRQPKAYLVVIWDVASRRVLGTLRVPDEAFAANGRSRRIALSGNGGRLAVSDILGTVRVYDVARISGMARAKPGSERAPTPPDAGAVREAYEGSVAKASESLVEEFDDWIQRLEKKAPPAGSRAAQVIARLKEEKARFAKHGTLPWSEPMWGRAGGYLGVVADVRARVLAAFGPSEVPRDLRVLVDNRVIARWKHQPAGQPAATITLYSSGKVNHPAGEHTWSFANGRLTLRWRNPQAPGGFWVDTCFVASDGLSFQGANQLRAKIAGTLITDE